MLKSTGLVQYDLSAAEYFTLTDIRINYSILYCGPQICSPKRAQRVYLVTPIQQLLIYMVNHAVCFILLSEIMYQIYEDVNVSTYINTKVTIN